MVTINGDVHNLPVVILRAGKQMEVLKKRSCTPVEDDAWAVVTNEELSLDNVKFLSS
jgi:hypothetical protein